MSRKAEKLPVAAEARSEPRLPADGPAMVQCLADEGGITSFHASITDLSGGGVGFLVYAPDIHLAPGTILRGCRILFPGRAPLVADLEVRHSQRITTADGRSALRSGCRLINPQLDGNSRGQA